MEGYKTFLENKCMDFAVCIVNLYEHLTQNKNRPGSRDL